MLFCLLDPLQMNPEKGVGSEEDSEEMIERQRRFIQRNPEKGVERENIICLTGDPDELESRKGS